MKVSEILQVKGSILYTINPDQQLSEAANIMAEKDIGSLVVMEFGDLVGMLTFREVLRALHEMRPVGGGTVRKHMDDHPITVTPDTEVNEVRRIMLEKHALPARDERQDHPRRDLLLRRGACRAGSAELRKPHAESLYPRLAG
jgi:CBS domain-containing protein